MSIPTEFDNYTLVLLRRPPDAPTLSEEDPAVRRGQLAIEVMTWLTPAGQLKVDRGD